jgi:hypothetical protein
MPTTNDRRIHGAATTTTTAKMRPELKAIAPERIRRLPVDPDRGYPVPWFVAWIDGKPEFRVGDVKKYAQAVREKLCWVCGEVLGRYCWFTIGPMCTINRISSEPPSHRECAEFSARACPFLARPKMERRPGELPDGLRIGDGPMFGGCGLEHNPGATVLYLPMTFARFADGKGGHLFHLGEPLEVEWWTEGRKATPTEAAAAFNLGADRLKALAELQGAAAVREFRRLHARALMLLPKG